MSVCRKLRDAFPDRVEVRGECATVTLLPDTFASVTKAGDVDVWDSHGTDYRPMLASLPDTDDVVGKLVALQAELERTAGFAPPAEEVAALEALPPYDPTSDALLTTLQTTVQTERALCISTYGTRFVFEPPSGTQRVYDASGLRGERNKFTARLRGTDARLLQTVRAIPQFDAFIRAIVSDVERNGLSRVAVICRAGRHRSVAIAEWLRQLYPSATVTHLTIHHHGE